MIRNLVIEFESAEPAIAEMKFDLLAQLPSRADIGRARSAAVARCTVVCYLGGQHRSGGPVSIRTMETAHDGPSQAGKSICPARALRRPLAGAAVGIQLARPTNHRRAGLAQRDNYDPRQSAARAATPVRRQDRAQRRAVDAVLARARRAPQ